LDKTIIAGQGQTKVQAWVTSLCNILNVPNSNHVAEKQSQPLPLRRSGRPDASMTLLTEVMERPLDPSYATAAARRTATGGSNPRWVQPWVLIGAVGLGLATSVAATHLHVPPSSAQETRTMLETQIRSRTSAIAQKTDWVAEITGEISGLQQAALTANDPVLAAQLQVDELHNGRTTVAGPGLVVTLADGGGGLTEVTSEHLVRDVDLQQVASALWAAGAEAIAINGQRLTSTTAIRNAGDAVLIDLVPVLGPNYQVVAIGNPTRMEANWAVSGITEYLAMLGAEFGIRAQVQNSPALEVTGTTAPALRYAKPLDLPIGNTSEYSQAAAG